MKLILFLLFFHFLLFPQTPILDYTFGESGKFTINLGFSNVNYTETIKYDDNTFFVAGSAYNWDRKRDIVISKVDKNGVIDLSFGDKGRFIAEFNQQHDDFLYSINLYQNSSIYFSGLSQTDSKVYLGKIFLNGTADNSFGNNGILQVPYFADLTCYSGYSVISENNILVVTNAQSSNQTTKDIYLQRLKPDGSPDLTFGLASKLTIDFNNGSNDELDGVKVLSDGSIIIFGKYLYNNQYYISVVKLDKYGEFVSSFGTNGKVNLSITGNFFAKKLIELNDGKLLFAGYTGNYIDGALLRLNSNGTQDNTFGSNGLLTYNFGTSSEKDEIRGIYLLSDNKIILTGRCQDKIVIFRINSNGIIDQTFGNYGFQKLNFYLGGNCGYDIFVSNDTINVFGTNKTFYDLVNHVALFKFSNNGYIISNFANNGIKLILVGFSKDLVRRVLQDAKGNIYCYASSEGADNNYANLLFAINKDGKLKNNLQNNAILFIPENIIDMVTVNNGIVLLTSKDTLIGNQYLPILYLRKYKEDLTLDNTFGKNGIVKQFDSYTKYQPKKLLLRNDGKLFIILNAQIFSFNEDGSKNNDWGSGLGYVTLPSEFTYVGGADFAENNTLVIGGIKSVTSSTDVVLVKFMPDGQYDISFGNQGIAKKNMGLFYTNLYDLNVYKADYSIIITGSHSGISVVKYNLLTMKFSPNGAPVLNYGSDGAKTYNISTTNDAGYKVQYLGTNLFTFGSASNQTQIFLCKIDPSTGELKTDFATNGIFSVFPVVNRGAIDFTDNNYFLLAYNQPSKYNEADIVIAKYQMNSATSIENEQKILPRFDILYNYPNPFNPSTRIFYKLNKNDNIILEIYNSLGQKIQTLYEGEQKSGEYYLDFNATNLPTGIYFCKLVTSDFTKTLKLVYIK